MNKEIKMKIRKINLPKDFDPMIEIVTKSFHYPDNPDWNEDDEEMQSFIDSAKSLKMIWPLFKIIGLFSKTVRNLLSGYIAEVDGKPAGIFMIQKRGTTDKWIVTTVGVLPEFRRRGIARKLVEAGMEQIKQLGGKVAILDVISGNLPAYSLYKDVGFEHFSGNVEFNFKGSEYPQIPEIPKGFELIKLKRFDWKSRLTLLEKITPDEIKKYEPVEVGRFKQPFIMKLLVPIIFFAQGQEVTDHAIMFDGKIIGRMSMRLQKKANGNHVLILFMDKEYPALAEFCVGYMLGKIGEREDGKSIGTAVGQWQPHVSDAFAKLGFVEKIEYHRLGANI